MVIQLIAESNLRSLRGLRHSDDKMRRPSPERHVSARGSAYPSDISSLETAERPAIQFIGNSDSEIPANPKGSGR